MKTDDIPDELKSTADMLRCAFPEGIEPPAYVPLLAILYEHMSDRNIALVISAITGRAWEEVLNDVYKIGSGSISVATHVLSDVACRLRDCGFDEWTKE